MHSSELLHKMFKKGIPFIHKTRLVALLACVSTLLTNKNLSLTKLGRDMKSKAKMRSNIQRVNRLVGNKKLHEQRGYFYRLMNEKLLKNQTYPIIHIDWSCLSALRGLYVLRASASMQGKGIVVYEEAHEKAKENNHQVHIEFLKNLRRVLPKGCCPILVTDAGFRGLWFMAVKEIGWHFVGRLRNRNQVRLENEEKWIDSGTLYSQASHKACFLGPGILTRRNEVGCYFTLFLGKKKSRKVRSVHGKAKQCVKTKRYSKSHREPWLLVSSLSPSEYTSGQIVGIYKKRMQIEEHFRETKSTRYGFSLKESLTRSTQRMNNLLLIAAITSFMCWIAGLITKCRRQAQDYQAHSAKFKNALSISFLGAEVLRRNDFMKMTEFIRGIRQLNLLLKQHHSEFQYDS